MTTVDNSPAAGAALLARLCAECGLQQVAIAPSGAVPEHLLYSAWLAADRHGEMTYLAVDAAVRRNPAALLSGVRTVVCVAVSYFHPDPQVTGGPLPAGEILRGQIARYARGEDYHLVLRARLNQLGARISAHWAELGRPVAFRTCVDSAPVLERALGARAGLGFIGKNTLLITPGIGSYTVLGELLLDVLIEPPVQGGGGGTRCGQCRLCLDACPTGALVGEYVLDARRCISYLTIELKGPIPVELRPLCGTWIFGCDICQQVCPWNAAQRPGDPAIGRLEGPAADAVVTDREARSAAVIDREARSAAVIDHALPDLCRLLGLGAAQFRRFVRRTALRRIHRAQLLRNVAVALGNVGDATAVPALVRALSDVALVRRHAAWALGEIGRRAAGSAPEALLITIKGALEAALASETDPEVAAEIASGLGRIALCPAEPVQDRI